MQDKDLIQLYIKYGLAVEKLNTMFVNLYKKYSQLSEENPIEHLKYRIKSEDSIKEKLKKIKNNKLDEESKYKFTAENIENILDDVVGYRVVCPFLCDVYKVIEEVRQFTGIKIIEERDYIKNPKKNGYSSYHFKVIVPVQLEGNQIALVKAEIQVRTIIMDMLATLEHKINYKKNINLSEKIKEKIKTLFFYCNTIDQTLNNVLIETQATLKKRKQQKNTETIEMLPSFVDSEEFQNLTLKQREALRVMSEKINQISLEYLENNNDNPIEHVKCRIKTKNRIIEKLVRKNIEINFNNIEQNINDIAGIRIVCPFIKNVETIIEELHHCEYLEIIQEQDYRYTPKDNGYASYHMLVLVPVEINGKITRVKVEIQIRTMIQEMWAILEERFCYQKNASDELVTSLKTLAIELANNDNEMNEIYKYSKEQQKQNSLKKILNTQN